MDAATDANVSADEDNDSADASEAPDCDVEAAADVEDEAATDNCGGGLN